MTARPFLLLCICCESVARSCQHHPSTTPYPITPTPHTHTHRDIPEPDSAEGMMSGRGRNVCVHYAYEPLCCSPAAPRVKKKKVSSGGMQPNVLLSELIFIMCAIEKSKLLFFSGARLSLSLLINISKQRRGYGGEVLGPGRPELKDRTRPG